MFVQFHNKIMTKSPDRIASYVSVFILIFMHLALHNVLFLCFVTSFREYLHVRLVESSIVSHRSQNTINIEFNAILYLFFHTKIRLPVPTNQHHTSPPHPNTYVNAVCSLCCLLANRTNRIENYNPTHAIAICVRLCAFVCL